MMAANVIDKSELPDFDEETGLLHKVGAFPGLSHFVRKLLKSPPLMRGWVILVIIYHTEKI